MHLLTSREAATILRLSLRTLERWRVAGVGPRFVRFPNRSIRYQTDAVATFVAARAAASTSQTLEEKRQ